MPDLDERSRAILAEEAEWRRTVQPAPGAHRIGDVALLDVGCTIYSSERGYSGVGPGGEQVEPIGGVILEVISKVDPETGEIGRCFRCIDPHRTRPQLTYHVILEDEINRETVEGPSSSRMNMLIRRLAEELSKRKGPQVGSLAADISLLSGLV